MDAGRPAAVIRIQMAQPAPAGAAVPVPELAVAPGPGTRREAKQQGRAGGPRGHAQCAGARLLSLAVQAAALAIFLLFAAASALLLLVLVLAARAFRHHRGSRYRVPSLDPSPPPSPLRAGLSPADIRRLPSFAFPSSASSADDEAEAAAAAADSASASCAVCLEAARAGERWRAMPACTHAFHAACVDRWLARTPACPVCRAAVAVPVTMS